MNLSEPGHEGSTYLIRERKKDTIYLEPAVWAQGAESKEGSWWISWQKWLVKQSATKQANARTLDEALPPAPGVYVLQKLDFSHF